MAAALLLLVGAAGRAAAQIPDGFRTETRGRFTAAAVPSDLPLARRMLREAVARDTFPGLPRPLAPALILIAPDERTFRALVGPSAPEWGAAIAFPSERRIIMQGRRAGSDAGNPLGVLRHELAHLALHEAMGDSPPRWFDEGYASYAATEWEREDVLATSVSLAFRGAPTLDTLEERFYGGPEEAQAAYALAYRAVADLAALDTARGLALLFPYWRETGSLDRAVRSAYGLTLADFERRWRSRTMRRYGLLSVVTDIGLAAGVMTILLLPLYLARRRRDRRRLAELVAADQAAERAAREDALSELLRSAPADPGAPTAEGASDSDPASPPAPPRTPQ